VRKTIYLFLEQELHTIFNSIPALNALLLKVICDDDDDKKKNKKDDDNNNDRSQKVGFQMEVWTNKAILLNVKKKQ